MKKNIIIGAFAAILGMVLAVSIVNEMKDDKSGDFTKMDSTVAGNELGV